MSDLYTSESSSEEFECKKCSKTFETKKDFALHKKEQHREKKYGCSLCQCQFSNRSNFVHHNKAHHENLATSKVLHTNVYTCPECLSEFISSRGLATHSSIHKQKDMDISPPTQRKELPAFVVPPFQKRKELETSNQQIRVIRPEKVPSPEIILEETSNPAFTTSSAPVSKSAFEKDAVNREKFFATVSEPAQEKDPWVPPKNSEIIDRIQKRKKTTFNIPLEAIHPFLCVEVVFVDNCQHVKGLVSVFKVEGENVVVTNKKESIKILVHYTQILFHRQYSPTVQYKTGDIIEVNERNRFSRCVFLQRSEKTASIVFSNLKSCEVPIDAIRPYQDEEVLIHPPKKQKL